MVKVLFALAKYLTWWFVKPLVSHCCVANLTHTLQISSFNQNACSSCFKQYFPFLPGGEDIHNYFIKSIASTHYFTKSITSSHCVEDTPGYTLVHTLVHDKYSPACWVSRKLRPNPYYIIPRIQYPQNVSGSATWLPICIAKLSRNRHCANRTLNGLNLNSSVTNLVYSYKANQTRFKCSVLF